MGDKPILGRLRRVGVAQSGVETHVIAFFAMQWNFLPYRSSPGWVTPLGRRSPEADADKVISTGGSALRPGFPR